MATFGHGNRYWFIKTVSDSGRVRRPFPKLSLHNVALWQLEATIITLCKIAAFATARIRARQGHFIGLFW